MTPVQKYLAAIGSIMMGLIVIIVLVGLARGNLPLGYALSLLSPGVAGIVLGIVGKAKDDHTNGGE
jgi:hypothetical protein